jgi:hypothetical protein
MAAPTPAAHLPTRQQLDEIDALLSRMLTLPSLGGSNAEDPSAPPTPAPPPVEMTFPVPAIHEVPPPRMPAPDEPVVREWRVQWPHTPAPVPSSVVAWGAPVPLATPAEDPYLPGPVPGPVYQRATYSATDDQFPVAEPVPPDPQPAPVRPPVSAALWPLIALNVTFDVLTYVLGVPGAWLRGPGRAVLGWLGVGMLLAAGVWAAGQWFGYDWPKADLSRLGLSP